MEPRPVRSQSAQTAHLIRIAVCGLCVLLSSAVLAAELILEVIALRHRLVRDMIPILQPLLAEGGTLTGTSNQLIVRTTRENLAEIREVVSNIDTRVKQFKITVTQDLNAVATLNRDAVSGHIEAGDVGASVPDLGSPGGAVLGVEGNHGGVTVHSTRTRSQDDSSNLHFVVGLEGQPAFIETGQDIPYPYSNTTITPYGVTSNSGIDYQNVSSGFYVTPRVQGDHVVLEVAPRLERVDPYGSGAIDSRATNTTVSGRLGEWIPLGGASTANGGVDSELLARTRRQGDNSYTVWIKVDEQP